MSPTRKLFVAWSKKHNFIYKRTDTQEMAYKVWLAKTLEAENRSNKRLEVIQEIETELKLVYGK